MFCLQDMTSVELHPATRRLRPVDKTASPLLVRSATIYDGFVRTAIRRWKYDGAVELTDWFASMMTNSLAQDTFDCIVPVPVSPDRLRKRGYHHIGLLCEAIASTVPLPVHEALVRVPSGRGDFTQSQTAKSAVDRLVGLKDAYQMNEDGASGISNRRILLIDDIVTTGATVSTCAKVLLSAGASSVTCAVIARVE